MQDRKVSVETIIDRFDLNIINKDEIKEYGQIYAPSIKRVGLELTRSVDNRLCARNVIAWGTTESEWFESIGQSNSSLALEHVFSANPPLIILSKGVSDEVKNWIVEIANKYQVPVAAGQSSTATITTTVGAYLNDYWSEEVQVHGCLVLIGGVGVMVVGQSGIGKSEATLDLVQRGHVFITDDAVLVKMVGQEFVGRSPFITRNFLEIRGIGPIDIKYTYGVNSVAESAQINLVVELVQKSAQNELDRLGDEFLKYPILNSHIKKIQIPVKDGSNTASLIEAAVSSYLVRKEGKSIISEINKRAMES
ncbi:HPr(Ser) kinase/phosphatase [Mycoplasma sp. Ms02]|uniref:HPr(Ser) kinase/phosphatase n=1 Tax=Mycoplasma sp. Ms02 TaxID=353851 RepID=UPI001C89B4B9|nr:HPr(Ser) kinase/phosphatase [Mycoplasma sp. Ms02]QZE12085.1 HPr(Ser) kinase/phosphatase [Mycoplasma sp. Ms02]